MRTILLFATILISVAASAAQDATGAAEGPTVYSVPAVPDELVNADEIRLVNCLHAIPAAADVSGILLATKRCMTPDTEQLAAVARDSSKTALQALNGLNLSPNTVLQAYLELFYRNFGMQMRQHKVLPKALSDESDSDISVLVVDSMMHAVINSLIAKKNSNILIAFDHFGVDNPQVVAEAIVQNALAQPESIGMPAVQIVRVHMH